MKVYPARAFRSRYLGEARIHSLLESIETDIGFAVHSVNLPDHAYKRWGEADFVIVNRDGIRLLEVKGGIVDYIGRVWKYQNARGEARISTEGPARQAMSAAIALEETVSRHLGRPARVRWGVAFPLSRFEHELVELPVNRCADVTRCGDPESFRQWLDGLPAEHAGSDRLQLSDSEVHALEGLLVPEFAATVALAPTVRGVDERVGVLTKLQYEIVDALGSNDRLCVMGGAGTGKTELVVLCALAEKANGRSPVVLTPSAPSLYVLRDRLSPHGITVTDAVIPAGCDTLLVDEGQDYVTYEQLTTIFSALPGGLEHGRWRWFMDPALQFSENPPDQAALQCLREAGTVVSLKHNVRSTREIVDMTRVLLGADTGIARVDGYGIRVSLHSVDDHLSELPMVQQIVRAVIEEGIDPTRIAVLSGNDEPGPTAAGIVAQMPEVLERMGHRGFPAERRGLVSTIRQFRGLEAAVVVLVDLDALFKDPRGRARLYVGMSRASAALHIVTTPNMRSFLKELLDP